MDATKQRIIKTAEKLFFEIGIANVRLQQIADAAKISVGNLAYHFRNKEAIVEAVYAAVLKDLSQMLVTRVKAADLLDFDELFTAIFRLVNRYPFCFNNIWEISRYYPAIKKKWENFLNEKLIRIQRRIHDHVRHGFLRPEPYKGAYKLLSRQLILNFFFWIPQQILNGKSASLGLFKKSLWNLLYPNFTGKGLRSYNKFIE